MEYAVEITCIVRKISNVLAQIVCTLVLLQKSLVKEIRLKSSFWLEMREFDLKSKYSYVTVQYSPHKDDSSFEWRLYQMCKLTGVK